MENEPRFKEEIPAVETEKKEFEPAIPRGWTFLKHGTNLIKWGDENPYNSDEIELHGPLSVVSKEQSDFDNRGGKYNTSKTYGITAKPEQMSEEEFAQKNKPFEIRILFYQDHARHNYDPEYRDGLDKKTMEQINKYYYVNAQHGRHPLVPKKETLVKLGQTQEDGRDIFYFVPESVREAYFRESNTENNPKTESHGPESGEQFLSGKVIKEGEFGIRELGGNPDKLVRKESMVGSVENTAAHYKKIQDLFEAMQNNYGINVPDMDIFIEKDEKGKESVFMMVDKIEGKDLGEMGSLPEAAQKKFEAFYTAILQSNFDGYKKSEPFFIDIKKDNIMYGHKSKEKDTEDDFFLADVGGGFQDGNSIEFHGQIIEVDYDEGFFRSIINATEDLQAYEKKFGENAVLPGIKAKLKELFEYCKNNKQQKLEAFIKKDPTAKEFFK